MKIATWNINGVRARIETATAWLRDAAPDIVCLQEIKSKESAFPREAFEELGYNLAIHGQKALTASPSSRSCRSRMSRQAFRVTMPTPIRASLKP